MLWINLRFYTEHRLLLSAVENGSSVNDKGNGNLFEEHQANEVNENSTFQMHKYEDVDGSNIILEIIETQNQSNEDLITIGQENISYIKRENIPVIEIDNTQIISEMKDTISRNQNLAVAGLHEQAKR